MAFNSYTGVNIPFTASNKQFIKSMQEAKGALGGFIAESSIGLTNAYSQMDRMQRQIQSGIGRTADSIKNFGKSLTTYLTLPMSLGGAASLAQYFELDAMAKGLDVITGSVQRTSNYMKQFLKDAAMPGLGYKETVQFGSGWLILGDNIQTARKKMQEFGNALALEGKGKDVFATINYQLVQMANKGKVMAEDLKPILSASSVIAKTISDRYNTTDSGDIQKALEKQGVGSKQFINQLVTDLSKLDRVVGGAKNSWENFTDSIFIGAAALGEFIDKGTGFQGIMDAVGNAIRKGAQYLSEMPLAWKQVISTMAMAALVAGPLLTVFGSLLKVAVGFTAFGQVAAMLTKVWTAMSVFALGNPVIAGVAAVAVGFGALALIIKGLNSDTDRAAESQKRLNDVMAEAKANAGQEKVVLSELVKTASDKSKSDFERGQAIKKLNQYAPEYLGNITKENIGTAESVNQIRRYIVYMEKKILFDAAATDFSIAHQKALKLAEQGKNPEAGFLDYAYSFVHPATAKQIATGRIRKEAADAMRDSNDAWHNMKNMERDMEKNMAGLKYTPLGGGGAGAGGKGAGKTGSKYTDADWRRDLEARALEMQANVKPDRAVYAELGMSKNSEKILQEALRAAEIARQMRGTSDQVKREKKELDESMKSILDQEQRDRMANDLAQYQNIFKNGFQNMAMGIADGLSEMTTQLLNGTFKWKNAGEIFRQLIGHTIADMGKAMIQMGTLQLAEKMVEKLAAATIPGALALIAIGTGAVVTGNALANGAGNGSTGGGSIGSVGGYSSPTYSGTGGGGAGGGNSALKIDLNLSGNFRIAGSDLVLAISRQTTLNANR